MLQTMNHREIEYKIKKVWQEQERDERTLCSQLCAEWQKDDQVILEQLLNWLDETGTLVYEEDLLLDYGTDCLRLYLMFEKTPKPNDTWLETWTECGLEGMYKFLGRYRRMILVADYWNRLGGYEGKDTSKLEEAFAKTEQEYLKFLRRGNDMPNRHNMVATMMELMKTMTKELGISDLITKLHKEEIAHAVPHTAHEQETTVQVENEKKSNEAVKAFCEKFVLYMSVLTPYLSGDLWERMEHIL